MNIKPLKFKLLTLILLSYSYTIAQNVTPPQKIEVNKAIEIGLIHNKGLLQQRGHIKVASYKEKDLKMEQLPDIDFHTSYNALGDIYQYENGLFEPSTKYKIPHKEYDFTMSASIPVYLGGKIKNHKKIAALETEKQDAHLHMDERKLRLQIITAFLKVLHLQEQQSLIQDKIREDKANIQQTKLLEKNGVVTNNEVLRTGLQLSNHKLAFSDVEKEIEIIEEQLKPLLGIEEEVKLEMVTTGLLEEDLLISHQTGGADLALKSSEELKMHEIDLKQSELDKKLVSANVLPSISLGGTYNYAYPNFKFFPPQEYLNRSGLVGVKLTLPLSNFYKNGPKMKIAHEQIHIAELKIKEEEEDIKSELFTAQMRYEQATSKIAIAKEAIEQAAENYRIVKTKYANQLSLITELIDADNAYLEARSNLISLTIDQRLKYYQLQYRLGNI